MRKSIRTSVGFLFAAGLLHGGIGAPRSVLELEQSADLIVVGSAAGDIPAGATAAGFTLQVSRVVKGDSALVGQALPVSWTSVDGLLASGRLPSGSHVTVSGTGLWFLQSSGNGWLLLPVVGGSVAQDRLFFPAPAGPIASAYAYGATASLSDKVASELAAAIEANDAYNMQLFLLSYTLDEVKSPVVQTFYERMSVSTSAEHQILGLSGLIRGGGATALGTASLAASQFEGYAGYSILLNSVRNDFRATDAGSIATLGQAAVDPANPSLKFREAAAHALASIHNLASLPYLAALVGDPDTALRIEAIGGLGSFANGTAMQTAANTPSLASLQLNGDGTYRTADTIANFAQGEQAIEQNEGGYVAFWSAWWLANRASLGY